MLENFYWKMVNLSILSIYFIYLTDGILRGKIFQKECCKGLKEVKRFNKGQGPILYKWAKGRVILHFKNIF